MTLAEYALWRLQAAQAQVVVPPEIVPELVAAALAARRAGVVPTLEQLTESVAEEQAWLEAGRIYAEEQALGAEGLTHESAVQTLHDQHTRLAFKGRV